jgi:hypothetical protein
MRYALGLAVVLCCAGRVAAAERPLEQLPQDVLALADAVTQPVQEVHRETRRFDPVSGLWFGLVEGSVKSFEHTAKFLLAATAEDDAQQERSGKNPLVKYSF